LFGTAARSALISMVSRDDSDLVTASAGLLVASLEAP